MPLTQLTIKIEELSRKLELFMQASDRNTKDFDERLATVWGDIYGNGKPGIKFCSQTLWDKSASWDRIKAGIITGVIVMSVSVGVNIVIALTILAK
jgi:hypothetical protein